MVLMIDRLSSLKIQRLRPYNNRSPNHKTHNGALYVWLYVWLYEWWEVINDYKKTCLFIEVKMPFFKACDYS